MDFDGTGAAKSFGGGRWRASERPCDNCRSAAAALFCKADAAFLCLACDAGDMLALRHERMWMCEVCESTLAAFACKADAAALCAACDTDVHSASLLASHHVRVPLEPFFDAATVAAMGSVTDFLAVPPAGGTCCGAWGLGEEAKSWLLPNPTKIAEGAEAEAGYPFWNEVDPFLGFERRGLMVISRINSECLVPVQAEAVNPPVLIRHPHQSGKCFDVDFSTSAGNLSPLSQSVSTSLDFGVVPDQNSVSETPTEHSNRAACQLSGSDCEARVLRYREKRKNRRFEKTIRYASRKAYAEARPRIKGRFAKTGQVLGTEDESIAVGVHGITADSEYGVVPTFSHVPIN